MTEGAQHGQPRYAAERDALNVVRAAVARSWQGSARVHDAWAAALPTSVCLDILMQICTYPRGTLLIAE
ncbi:MAG: hypothetical protein H5T86_16635 [Armatimonadetes bacterium]|nr:hypothetical protein [Armatimonadota bacterium]